MPLLPLLEDCAEVSNNAAGKLITLRRLVMTDLYRQGRTENKDVIKLESSIAKGMIGS